MNSGNNLRKEEDRVAAIVGMSMLRGLYTCSVRVYA